MTEIRDKNGLTEKEFLAAYSPGDYERPSVAVDMVIFTVMDMVTENYRRLPEKELKILLIQRGGHPYLGKWALPGGFVEPDETTEQAAERELVEETSAEGLYLEQLYTFSDPHRDPRTWVMSCSYMALADSNRINVRAGDDARSAEWFTVSLDENIIEENRTLQSVTKKTALELVLKSDKKMLTAEIIQEQIRSANGTKNTYTITSSDGIAFDHAKIIAYALQRLRGKIEYTDIALNLMPELFTLTQLQQVYEIILDRQLIKAPFRRKYGLLAEPTDETTSDEGHRPSRLFRRKWL